MCERFNRTLLGMLGTMEQHQKSNWKTYVAPMVHAYNCTKHEPTGVSPYFLMFGRHSRLPIDLAFGINKESKQPVGSYLKNLRDRLTHAYQFATEVSRNAQVYQREGYEIKFRGATIQKGVRVLAKQVYFDGKHKPADTWGKVQYVVVDQAISEIPVFIVTREDGEGRTVILHRNLLLPVGLISKQEIPLEKPNPVPRQRTRQQKSVAVQPSASDDSIYDSTDESEDEYVLRPVDSESTLTENSDGPAHDISILSGDVHHEDIQGQEMEIGSASDTAEVEDETPQDTELKTPVPVRRFVRERRKPAWLTSGQYDVSKSATFINQTSLQQQILEWQHKADYITSLCKTSFFSGLEGEAAKTILEIINHHQ